MRKLGVLFAFLFVLNICRATDQGFVSAAVFSELSELTENQIIEICSDSEMESGRPNPIFQLFKKRQKKDAKVTALIFAFPFPFGLVGLHRIYLGCAPYIPVVYIATLGGVFGILPLIDFIVLAASKDLDSFVNNQKVFMWVK